MRPTESNQKTRGKDPTGASQENDRSADTEDLPDHIATAAYYKAEVCGFTRGLEIDDWLKAETELSKSVGFQ